MKRQTFNRQAPKESEAACRPGSTRTIQPEAEPDSRIEKALRSWRLDEARRGGVPAFLILTDKVLRAIAAARPATSAEILAIPGIGMSTIEKYGAAIHRILNRSELFCRCRCRKTGKDYEQPISVLEDHENLETTTRG